MGDSDDKKDQGNCRDYERGVCNRGNKCKFYHSPDIPEPGTGDTKLPICKDFQNETCHRKSCKFLHITQQEEAIYNDTGKLPENLSSRRSNKPPRSAGGSKFSEARSKSGEPCKDFMNGVCKRSNCKFAHIPENQVHKNGGGMYGKRRRDDYGRDDMEIGVLRDENEMLKRKITDLQRQVIDLRDMNDALYDQNTRYRTQLRGNQTVPTSIPASTDPYAASSSRPAIDPYVTSVSRPPIDPYTKSLSRPPIDPLARSVTYPPIDSSRNFYDDYRKF